MIQREKVKQAREIARACSGMLRAGISRTQ
jgi:hypothetical protein